MSKDHRTRVFSSRRKKEKSVIEIPALPSLFSSKRLTMRTGIFKFGKRSQTISRVVSEEAKARADEDLQRLLDLSRPSSGPTYHKQLDSNRRRRNVSDVKDVDLNSQISKNSSPRFRHSSTFSIRNHQRMCYSTNSSNSKKTNSSFSSSTVTSVEHVKDEYLPNSPCMSDIANDLCSSLKKCTVTMLGNRDLNAETKSVLKEYIRKQGGSEILLSTISCKMPKEAEPGNFETTLPASGVFQSKQTFPPENISNDIQAMDGVQFLMQTSTFNNEHVSRDSGFRKIIECKDKLLSHTFTSDKNQNHNSTQHSKKYESTFLNESWSSQSDHTRTNNDSFTGFPLQSESFLEFHQRGLRFDQEYSTKNCQGYTSSNAPFLSDDRHLWQYESKDKVLNQPQQLVTENDSLRIHGKCSDNLHGISQKKLPVNPHYHQSSNHRKTLSPLQNVIGTATEHQVIDDYSPPKFYPHKLY